MANQIKAIHALRPRIKMGPTVQMNELTEFMAGRTGLSKGSIRLVLAELQEAIVFYAQQGRGVKLEGLGTYLPNVRLNGEVNIQHRQSPEFKRALNQERFAGTIINRKHMGKTPAQLLALWNELHPEDVVE